MAEAVEPADPRDIRPLVRTADSGNAGLIAFALILLVGGLWLFSVLSANREEAGAPRVTIPAGQGSGRISSAPPPELPARFLEPGLRESAVRLQRDLPRLVRVEPQPAPPSASARIVRTAPEPAWETAIPPEPVEPRFPQPSVIFDRDLAPAAERGLASEGSRDRVLASRLANPSLTVPIGTMIPAVLETALDSTRPGAVRALVQRDVRGFDGSRVLIHRGSRLYGEYDADLQRGQKRALIRWTRLLRPDGVTIALDSPAADLLGRAGVEGDVDGKFFQRFGNAILQSVLDIGVGIATRAASDGVIVALPGSTQNISGSSAQEIQPTLRVKHGTSVSVYVARDLDFSSVEF